MTNKRKPGAGRKPQGEFAGKSATFSTRITAELRKLLDDEAADSGQSISQIVERRLRDSFDQPKRRHEVLGGDHIRALSYVVAQLVISVEAATGRRWTEDDFTGHAVKAAVGTAVNFFRPNGNVHDPALGSIEAPERVRQQVAAMLEKVDDPHYADRLLDPILLGYSHASAFLGWIRFAVDFPWKDAMYSSMPTDELRITDTVLFQFIAKNLARNEK